MFNPTRDQTRRFLIDSWRKRCERLPASALETLAGDLIELHPEYQALLAAPDAAEREWLPADGQINPFLHLSLHLAIEEQLSIDQPAGLRPAFEALLGRMSRHDALHVVLEALGETIWRAQHDGTPLDGVAYVEAVRRAH